MVMAAGAADGERQHRAGGRVDLVVDIVHQVLLTVALVEVLAAHGQEAGGHQPVPLVDRGLFRQQVAGDLLSDELVIGLVVIEGINHVVAVAPGEGEGEVARTTG